MPPQRQAPSREAGAFRPLIAPGDIAFDMVSRAKPFGVDELARNGMKIRVATMCSGTEAPIFALHELQKAGLAMFGKRIIEIEHVFAAEIVVFKQAYIKRNSEPGVLFRDVLEFATSTDGKA